jgi:uncharacterized coiled-coil DUF342 family protein
MSKEEITVQFDSAVEQLKRQLSTLPESISVLVNFLIASFNMLFELTANQNDSMKASIDSLQQTIDSQTNKIQELADKLGLKNQEILKFHELIKSLKTLLKSKAVDIDALIQLLFQGGSEQKEQPAPQEKAEKPQSKKQNPRKTGQ